MYQRLVRDEKLREVFVSSFFELIIEEISVNKYCTKAKHRAAIGETQSSHCQRTTALPRRMSRNVFDAM